MTGLAMDEGKNRQPGGELDEYLARTPEDPLLRRARGLTLLAMGKPAEARPDLEASSRGIEDDPLGRSALAECLLEIGSLDGTDGALGPEPSRPIDRTRWWVVRGQLEEARGRTEPALDAYREALRARPDDRKALYRLGQALVRLGRAEEGRPLLARAEEVRLRDLTIVLEMDRCLRGAVDADLFEKIADLCRQAGLAFRSERLVPAGRRARPDPALRAGRPGGGFGPDRAACPSHSVESQPHRWSPGSRSARPRCPISMSGSRTWPGAGAWRSGTTPGPRATSSSATRWGAASV